MLLPKFDFLEPETITETCQILSDFGTKAKLIAGGTDLMVNMKKRLLSPEAVVSISRLPELNRLEFTQDRICMGACVTISEICESKKLDRYLPALVQGAKNLGTPLIRNLATIGGNIGSARPAADLPPALIAYRAEVVLQSLSGTRTMPMENFFLGPGFTAIRPDEILTEFRIPIPSSGTGAAYFHIGVRKGQDCNLVNVASCLALDENGRIRNARIVMGCVGPTPLRATNAEKILIGQPPDENLLEQAGKAAGLESRPIDDFRAPADFKRAMAGVLTRRTLAKAWDQAKTGY